MPEDKLLDAIMRRFDATVTRYGKRNEAMTDQFKAYDGDIWLANAKEEEQRVTVYLVADTVDMDTAILLSRPPIITVPPSDISGVDGVMASLLENSLVGAWNMMGFYPVLVNAGRNASLTGWGVIRGPIKVDDERFPLACFAPDPRSCYPGLTATRELRWHFYQQWRTVGDILSEIPGPARKLRGVWHKDALPKEEDKTVCWTEYWGWHDKDLVHAIFIMQGDESQGYGTPPNSNFPKTGTTGQTQVEPGDMNVLKDPVVMNKGRDAFYQDIPFLYFWPRASSRSEPGMEGMGVSDRLIATQKALSMLATVLATDALNKGTPPLWADGPIMSPIDSTGNGYIDTRAGGFTQMSSGAKLQQLPGVMEAPLVKQLYDMLDRIGGRSGFPANMFGIYEAAMSGLALSTLNNPVLIKESMAQKLIEEALQRFNIRLLKSLRRLPPSTTMYGTNRKGMAFDLSRAQMPDSAYTYNIVQLSASLPKDIPAMIATAAQARQVKGMSQRTFMEYNQNLLDLPSKDPELEWDRMQEEDVMQAKANVDTQAAIMAYETLVKTNMLGKVPMGGPGGQTPPGPDVGPGGVPSNAMPPQMQGMGAGLAEGLGMAGQAPPNAMIPGPLAGAQGAPA